MPSHLLKNSTVLASKNVSKCHFEKKKKKSSMSLISFMSKTRGEKILK